MLILFLQLYYYCYGYVLGETGYYANNNTNRSILIEGCFFQNPPGGVEAMIQLSIALSVATNKNEIFVTYSNYNEKWEKLYGHHLIRRKKKKNELQSGDIYIYNEGLPCVEGVPLGVNIFIYLLANYMGCKPSDGNVRYISHNEYLSNFIYNGQQIKLPRERIIHPYLSLPFFEKAFNRASLHHNGIILYSKSELKYVKERLVLIDNDVPFSVVDIIKKAAINAGGSAIVLESLSQDEIIEAYEKGIVVIDWCMRGSERCPLEAALFGSVVISNKCATALSFQDFPVPSKFILSSNITNESKSTEFELNTIYDEFLNLFKEIFSNYWEMVPLFEPFRNSILQHNPSSINKDVTMFLSTTHIDQNANVDLNLMQGGCIAC
jgi:hypothetical protein